MAATPEKKVKDAVKKILDTRGVWHFSPASNGMGRAGIPDIICCVRGYFLAIECKAGKGKTTALQEREIDAIHEAGGVAIVVNETNIQTVQEWIDVLVVAARDPRDSRSSQ